MTHSSHVKSTDNTCSSRPLHAVLSGHVTPVPPVWIMRQAGRHLPEYRALRASFPSFMDFCYTPEAAAEATLQPITRYDMDAAVIFSDILTVPDAMGCDVTFIKNSGPVVTVPEEGVHAFDPTAIEKVYEAIRMTRAALPPEKSLIGFCGLPWTLWLYMAGVPGEKEFATARRTCVSDPDTTAIQIGQLTHAVISHAKHQIDAGADVIQLFESWAGLAPAFLREHLITSPAADIVAAIKAYAPDVRVILFAKGLGEGVVPYIQRAKPHGAGVDPFTSITYVRDGYSGPLQGNFDPHLLFAERDVIKQEVDHMKNIMSGRPYIANLGHGMLPQTHPDNVAFFIDALRH